MPVYFAGWVRGDATVRFGSGFSVTRVGVTGSYRITVSTSLTAAFLATTVTPVATGRVARVAVFAQDPISKTSKIDVEIRDIATGALVDCDFNFIAIPRS
jgi:hypothetical protein